MFQILLAQFFVIVEFLNSVVEFEVATVEFLFHVVEDVFYVVAREDLVVVVNFVDIV